MQSQKPYLCMTCGGKKHTSTHKKYYTAGIQKVKGSKKVLDIYKGIGGSILNIVDGAIKGVTGIDTPIGEIIKSNNSSLLTNNGKNYGDRVDKTFNTVNSMSNAVGSVAAQTVAAAYGIPPIPKIKGDEPVTPITPNPTNPATLPYSEDPNNFLAQTGGNTNKIIPTEGGVLKRLSSTAMVAKGNTHDNGGIMLDEETEVEDKEGIHNIEGQPVISSNVLENKNTDNSFAKDMTKLEKEKGGYEDKLLKEYEKTLGKDNYNTLLYKKRIKQLEDNIKDLFLQQEELAAKMGLRDSQGNPNQTSQDVVGDEQGIKELQNQVENQGDTNPQPQQEVPVNQRYGGIQINPKNKGKFTKKADAKGKSVQEFANEVMRNKEDYSTVTVKQANFAKNAKKFKHEHGGYYDEQMLGYKKGSPYADKPYIDIDSNLITMKGVSKPILAIPNVGNPAIMQPEKEYYFPKATKVREVRFKAQTGTGFNTPLPKTKFDFKGLTQEQLDWFKTQTNTPSKLTKEQELNFQNRQVINDIASTAANFSNAFAKRAAPKALPVTSNPYPNMIQAANRQFTQSLADAKAKSREDLANVMNRAIYSGNDSNPVITTQLTAANKANNEFMDKLGQNILNNNTVLSQEDLKKREADNLYKNMVYMNKANFANDMTQLRQDALAKQAEYMNDKLAKEKELVYIGQMPVNQRNEYFKNVFGSKMRLGNKKKYGGKISKKKFL